MNRTTLGFRMRVLWAGLAVGAALYVIPCPAKAQQGPLIARANVSATDPGAAGALAFVHNEGKLNAASVRNPPDAGTGLPTLLPTGLTPRVPEPGTLGLLILGAPLLLRGRRRTP